MADRRRRRRATSDEESEEISSESERDNEDLHLEEKAASTVKKEAETIESKPASTDDIEDVEEVKVQVEKEEESSPKNETEVKNVDDDEVGSQTELIDEDGGGEGIAETEEIEGDFLEDEILDGSEDGEEDEEDYDEGDRRVKVDEEDYDEGIGHTKEDEDDYDEGDGSVKEERQQGDGEECSPNAAEKELDFDEDRRNPQYIPKKGIFYEHDDRNAESPKEKEEDPTRDKKKKKLWLDDGKWGHDRYREDEQIPKSRNELIDAYGYDIRCEDGPPRARRRRRYGRGPTKYEPNWSEEGGPGKERTLGMFIRRGTRGGRARGGGGRFRGNFNRGSGPGRQFNNKSESEESIVENNNVEEVRPVERNLPVRPVERNLPVRPVERNQPVRPAVIEPAKETKDLPLCGWESEESPADETMPVPLNNKEFPALPAKEDVVVKSVTPDRGSAFTRRKPVVPNVEAIETNSVRTQTFENSTFANNRPPSFTSSYEKPPRHGGDNMTNRGPSRGYRRMSRGRPPRGMDRYNNNSDTYLKSSVGPRLQDKQINRVSSELEKLNLNNRKETYENADVLAIQEQKQMINHPVSAGMKQNLNVGLSSKHEDSASRPKRYSSLRQRSLPESATYQPAPTSVPPHPHPPYYEAGYPTAIYAPEAVTSNPQPPSSISPPVISPSQYQPYSPSPYQESYSIRMPVNNAPRFVPQVTVPPGQPLMTPPPCIAPLNYPPPTAPPTYPPHPQYAAYSQYPTPTPPPQPPVSQTPEMFRPGITYYYAQPAPVIQVPQKRPKAAIPIIPPPENEMKMHDRKRLEEQQYSNVDSGLDRTDSTTLQIHAPVEVES